MSSRRSTSHTPLKNRATAPKVSKSSKLKNKSMTLSHDDWKLVGLLILIAISCGLTQGGLPVSISPYIMAYLSLTSYTYRSTSNPNFFTTPKRLFITSALFNAVVVGIVVASSLPLKGPAVPLLCVYVGFQVRAGAKRQHITYQKHSARRYAPLPTYQLSSSRKTFSSSLRSSSPTLRTNNLPLVASLLSALHPILPNNPLPPHPPLRSPS